MASYPREDEKGANVIGAGIELAERGWLPDRVIRAGIRGMLRERLREIGADDEAARERTEAWIETLVKAPIALLPEQANAQHYAVPPAFFETVLGPWRKYSCALWEPGCRDLGQAEAAMLDATCRRAGLQDGMSVLDLGSGWGSLTRWVARHYPRCRVLAVSNSGPQVEFVRASLAADERARVRAERADVNEFDPDQRFDRVISVEMFEHARNWQALLARVARWLSPHGRAFVHVFCHRSASYPYEARGEGDWMAKRFFSGGMMPSESLLLRFQRDLVVERQWRVSGEHYRRTAEAWLANLDARRDAARAALAAGVGAGPGESARALQRWRMFFLACAELFGWNDGREWFVAHYRLAPRAE
jgi:cyclopropane-fatty-acyl-phospholipid synthase